MILSLSRNRLLQACYDLCVVYSKRTATCKSIVRGRKIRENPQYRHDVRMQRRGLQIMKVQQTRYADWYRQNIFVQKSLVHSSCPLHFANKIKPSDDNKQLNEWESLLDNEEKKQNVASIPTRKENIFTIPNLLSLGRIVAAPFIGNMILNGDYILASTLLVIAGVSDVLDGQIARRWPSQQSAFGTALDPLGDKILVAVLTVTLTKVGMLPMPLAFLILGRDISLVASVFYLRYRTCPPPKTIKRFFDPTLVNTQLNPTMISKVNTVLQISVLYAALVAPVFHFTDSIALKLLYFTTGATTIWSGVSYIFDKSTVQILKDGK